ncbi:MUTL-like protein [Artemisia annua]|uniref:MUTL-like protein n=1 Tax=Artemisia annua TaxID=35608 RepID=A0A2U1P5V0_ARTAN|nr:MUTL-like protein [Artemisia annua]
MGAFSCKKGIGAATAEFIQFAVSRIDAIRSVYGASFTLQRRTTMVLFINGEPLIRKFIVRNTIYHRNEAKEALRQARIKTQYEDLPILCERHTTSKLTSFEDLQSINTMGFRGEAVTYRDGVMESEPKACAAVKGTQIMYEDLLMLLVTYRDGVMESEPKACAAVKGTQIMHGAATADVHSVAMSSRIDAIRSVMGLSCRNLIKVEASDADPSSSVFKWMASYHFNYSAKKTTMVLFINERLVECSALKRAIEVVYAATLPKASKPFLYMSIVLPPDHVDVNVHPTKREVSLLNQEVIVEKIQSTIEMKLRSFNEAGTYQEQAVDSSPISSAAASKVSPMNTSTSVKPSRNLESSGGLNSIRSSIRQRRNPKETADLTSVQELINEFERGCHSGLLDIVRNCTYVGMADDVFAILQHNTHLYLANVVNLSKELMYQLVLQRFGYFNAIQLSDPVSLQELITLALKEEDPDSDGTENDDLKGKIAEAVDSSPISSVAASKVSPMNTSMSGSQKVYAKQKVRTDLQDPSGRMHAYLQVKPSRNLESSGGLNSIRSSIRQRRNPKETADLTSVQELINEFERGCHSGLLDIVRNCTYVGMADDVFALLQHNTHLYLANVVNLSKELMYQLVLQRFGYFNAIQLSDPVSLQELITLALKEEDPDSDGTENDDLKGKIAEMNTKLLIEKTELLDEYFGIYVDPQGNLSRLPVILDQHTPDMDRVPEFALCLGNDVLWNDEKVCFQTIAAALGNFYAMHPPLLPNPSGDNSDFYKRGSAQGKGNVSEGNDIVEDGVDNELLSEAENAWAQREWSIQHVLFPSMRLFFKPPTSMATNGTFVQHTPDMDRVPEFALCLGNDVLWNDEKVCFQTIAAALGNFYAMHPPLLPNPSGDNSDFYKSGSVQGKGSVSEGNDMVEDGVDNELLSEAENAWAQREWSIQHVLFPSMRLFFKPPTSMATNGTFVQVASLEKLYKVFERC